MDSIVPLGSLCNSMIPIYNKLLHLKYFTKRTLLKEKKSFKNLDFNKIIIFLLKSKLSKT